jgi:hypothetical protein
VSMDSHIPLSILNAASKHSEGVLFPCGAMGFYVSAFQARLLYNFSKDHIIHGSLQSLLIYLSNETGKSPADFQCHFLKFFQTLLSRRCSQAGHSSLVENPLPGLLTYRGVTEYSGRSPRTWQDKQVSPMQPFINFNL